MGQSGTRDVNRIGNRKGIDQRDHPDANVGKISRFVYLECSLRLEGLTDIAEIEYAVFQVITRGSILDAAAGIDQPSDEAKHSSPTCMASDFF